MNKKHYLCRRKKNAVIMKNLLLTYFDRSQVGRTDYFRQLIFLTFASLSILLFGLHLFGSYGLTVKPALACSACYVVASAVAIIVYLLNGPRKLKRIMPAFLVTVMVVQSVRLLVLASMGHHDPMLTTVNVTACSIIVLVASISILPRTSLLCAVINILAIALCWHLTYNPMYGQLFIIFGLTNCATTVFVFVANKLLHEQQMELDDYADTIDQILHVFNMTKAELLAILQLAKTKDTTVVYDKKLMAQLDKNTLRNIINVAYQIEQLQTSQHKDMRERFPMLTPAELDVCMLVEQGLTLKEISSALGKSVSNVSTVRGNIRKKLGLEQDDDLKKALLEK